jgi:hypothetical protein
MPPAAHASQGSFRGAIECDLMKTFGNEWVFQDF